MDSNFSRRKNVVVSSTLPEKKWTSPNFLFNQLLVLFIIFAAISCLSSATSIMLFDWDTFRSAMVASHVLTRCIIAQVAVGNDWHSGAVATGFKTLRRGLGLSPGTWGASRKRNADGARGILGTVGRAWALRSDLTKKTALCHTRTLGDAYDKYQLYSVLLNKAEYIYSYADFSFIQQHYVYISFTKWKTRKTYETF